MHPFGQHTRTWRMAFGSILHQLRSAPITVPASAIENGHSFIPASPIYNHARVVHHYPPRLLRLLLPLVVVPDGMLHQLLDQARAPQRARQRQVSLGGLLHVVDELGRAEPALLALDFAVLRVPPDLSAEYLEVLLALTVLSLLHAVTELAPRKLVPQALDGREVRGGDALHLGEVDEVPSLLLGTGEDDERVAGELIRLRELSRRQHRRERDVIHAHVAGELGRDLRVGRVRVDDVGVRRGLAAVGHVRIGRLRDGRLRHEEDGGRRRGCGVPADRAGGERVRRSGEEDQGRGG
mmetsp:Transcript_56993/g.121003  ORF Transcript_56993/g.121003 Transcript_56993/m.121003 type:complete len:295 (+) Transcript_56993:245-1129(+)